MHETENITPVPKKRKLRLWILSAVALLIAVAIIAGCVTNWFGFYGPTAKLLLAGEKTLTASSFTARATLQAGQLERSLEIQGQINTHQREITLVGRYADETLIRFAIYKGFLIRRTGFGKYSAQDIHAELEQFFSKDKNTDWEALLQSVSESLYEEYGDRLNYDAIDPALLSLYRLSNNPKWLKSTAGLTRKTEGNQTIYRFAPTADAAPSILACFQPVFTGEDYAALLEELTGQQEMHPIMECTISNGYLTGVKISAQKSNIDLSAGIDFEKIGNTVIDFEALSNLLARAS